jgi:hypothetical protein
MKLEVTKILSNTISGFLMMYTQDFDLSQPTYSGS